MTEGTGASRGVVALAALFGLAAVAAGAFATHGLKQKGLVEAAGWVETASRYQMWHALAMLLTAVLLPGARAVPWLFAGGIVLFSGSLYLLAAEGPRFMVFLTPLGGLLFLLGWTLFAFRAWRGSP
ncbi:MAG: DUF423 domain-containing protein [Geminicoccaceae bacterium]|nr:DUF423 domain-containing protein [Geminicoccaceae bacterium]